MEPFILMAQDHRRKKYITSKPTMHDVELYISKLDPGAACFGPMILSCVEVYQGEEHIAEYIDPEVMTPEELKGMRVVGEFVTDYIPGALAPD